MSASQSISSDRFQLTFIAVTALILLKIAFEVIGGMSQSFWLDETATWYASKQGIFRVIEEGSVYPLHLAYYLLTTFIIGLGFEGEFLLRLPSALFLIHTIRLLYLLSIELSPTKQRIERFAVLSVVFLAFNSGLIASAVQARPYSMLLWLSALSLTMYVRYIREPCLSRGVLAAGLTILVIVTHPLYASLLAMQFLLLVYLCSLAEGFQWRNFLRASIELLCVATLSLLIIFRIGVFDDTRAGRAYTYLPEGSFSFHLGYFESYFSSPLWVLFLIIIIYCGIQNSPRFFSQSVRLLLLLALLMTTPLIFLSLVGGYYGVALVAAPHYSFLDVVGKTLLFAVGIDVLKGRFYYVRNLIVLALAAGSLLSFDIQPHAEDWRSIAHEIKGKSEGSSCIAFVVSGHIEALDDSWLRNEEARNAWAAPLLAYGVDRICAISPIGPIDRSDSLAQHTRTLVRQQPRKIFLALRSPSTAIEAEVVQPLEKLLRESGYLPSGHQKFGVSILLTYEAPTPVE